MIKKVFPSQERYLKNNPSVTFRLKKDQKEKLDSIIKATGKPLSKWMSDFILDKLAPYEEISNLQEK
jgi:predicted DNA-binding protein